MCVLKLICIYILPEISAHHLQLKCMGSHFFPCHPYIESTTVLSDISKGLVCSCWHHFVSTTPFINKLLVMGNTSNFHFDTIASNLVISIDNAFSINKFCLKCVSGMKLYLFNGVDRVVD